MEKPPAQSPSFILHSDFLILHSSVSLCLCVYRLFQLRPDRNVFQESRQHRLAALGRSRHDHAVRLQSFQLAWRQVGHDHHFASDQLLRRVRLGDAGDQLPHFRSDIHFQAQQPVRAFDFFRRLHLAVNGATPKGYSSYSQTFGNPSISYNSLFTGFFAQDTWKPLRNLTLTYGLRYDLYQVPNADKNSLFSFSQSFRTDNNNVGPRLGLAYGLGHDQKTVIRASTGIFYDPPQTDQYRLALLNNGSPAFFNITATPSSSFAPAFPAVFTALPTGFSLATQNITTVAPDFATLYSYNATVSVTRELSSNFVVSASYLHTAGNRLPVYSNINLVPSGAFLADGRPIFSTTARVFPGFANILAVQSVGHSNYNGANITLNKRLSKGYEFYATYTWSHAIDDAPEQNNIDSGNFLLSDPSNRARDRANSLTDKRHTFNMTGVFMPEFSGKGAAHYLVNHNRLSIGLVAASGDLFNIGSNQILNGDPTEGTAFQRPLFIGRNTVRAPAVFELNARYSRLFQVGEKRSFEFLAESTNLTNTLNVISLNTTAKVDATGAILTPSPNAATGGRDQRLIQMGLRFNF